MDNKDEVVKSNKAVVTNQFPKKNSNRSIICLVFGILSLVFCWTMVLPIVIGISGIIIGIISIASKREGKNMAVVGIALSITGILLGLTFLFLMIEYL